MADIARRARLTGRLVDGKGRKLARTQARSHKETLTGQINILIASFPERVRYGMHHVHALSQRTAV